jgi:hypothetical protein
MTNIDKERAEFEKIARGIGHTDLKKRQDDGTYYNFYLQCAYEGWQASAARSAEEIAELEAEVVRLKSTLSNMVQIFENCEVIAGVCMCGEDMSRHSSNDHIPCDMGQYYAGQYVAEAKKLTIEAMKGGA